MTRKDFVIAAMIQVAGHAQKGVTEDTANSALEAIETIADSEFSAYLDDSGK